MGRSVIEDILSGDGSKRTKKKKKRTESDTGQAKIRHDGGTRNFDRNRTPSIPARVGHEISGYLGMIETEVPCKLGKDLAEIYESED